jgi:hypothetical protein
MQVIAGFFGSGALAALPVDGAAFSPYFKKLAQFAKLATSYVDVFIPIKPSVARA